VGQVWGIAAFSTNFVVVLIALGRIMQKYFQINNYVILADVKNLKIFIITL
jgi:hypothetical protein